MNKIFQGDNILSLDLIEDNSIDTIYIDPPYNTNLKTLSYKDTFENYPLFIKERLLKANYKLKETGVIFISIDEHSFSDLKIICDEIFLKKNYIETFIWVKNSTKNNSKTTSCIHEYILCYAKNKNNVKGLFRIKKPGIDEVFELYNKNKNKSFSEIENILKKFYKENTYLKGIKIYNRVDENGIFQIDNAGAPGGNGIRETVFHPKTGKACALPSGGWRYSLDTLKEHIKNNRLFFGSSEKQIPRYKRYLHEVETEVVKSVIFNYDDGEKDLFKIFNKKIFTNAKPVSLIKFLIQLTTPKNGIVLDFFAGSGTTGQSVIELNLEEKATREVILCVLNENNICSDILIPRMEYLCKKYNQETFKLKVLD